MNKQAQSGRRKWSSVFFPTVYTRTSCVKSCANIPSVSWIPNIQI